ncbi:hypothetical protein BGX29_011142, partial [Mortierella sp. GBA35]
ARHATKRPSEPRGREQSSPRPPPTLDYRPSPSTGAPAMVTSLSSSTISSKNSTTDQNRSKTQRTNLRSPSSSQQQQQQQQKSRQTALSQRPQRQRQPRRILNPDGKEDEYYSRNVGTGKPAHKRQKVSNPFRTQEEVGDGDSDDTDEQEAKHAGSASGKAVQQGKKRTAQERNTNSNTWKDDDGNDTDDFQTLPRPTRSMMSHFSGKRHDYGQGKSNKTSDSNSGNNNRGSTVPALDLSKYPPYPEHLDSVLPKRCQYPLSRSQEKTRTTIPSTLSTFSPLKLSSSKESRLQGTLRKPKVEEQDGKIGQLPPSSSPQPGEDPAHEADLYKTMEDHGIALWKQWCTTMGHRDKDRVTATKVKDYIDFEVMPKERDMMRKSWRLPGHPGFIAISGLEAYIRPVMQLWCEQALSDELEMMRDKKLKANQAQQQLQQQLQQQHQQQQQPQHQQQQQKPPAQQKPPQSQPTPQIQNLLRTFPQQKPPQQTKQPILEMATITTAVTTASMTTTMTIHQEGSQAEDGEVVENEDKEVEKTRVDRKEHVYNEDDTETDEERPKIRSSRAVDQTKSIIDIDSGMDTAGEGVSKSTLPITSVLSTVPPTSTTPAPIEPPSPEPPVVVQEIRAENIHMFRMKANKSKNTAHTTTTTTTATPSPTSLPTSGTGTDVANIKYHLNRKIDTIAGVLAEWAQGWQDGPAVQQLNLDHGLAWRYSEDAEEYHTRGLIVREFKRLVQEHGRTDKDALWLLEDELKSSSWNELAARLQRISGRAISESSSATS